MSITSATAEVAIEVLESVDAFVSREQGLRLGSSAEVQSSTGRTLTPTNPTDATVLGEVASGSSADIDTAVKLGQQALQGSRWGGASPNQRAQHLFDLADAVEAHSEELAQLETLSMGKPITQSRDDIVGVSAVLRYFGGWPTKLSGTINPVRNPLFGMSQYEPLGVCAAITPWNFPLAMVAHKVGPTLAAGNAVVIKPASATPYTALRLADLAAEVGLPHGVLSVVPGSGSEVGDSLVSHPDIAKVSFTGSSPVGHGVLEGAARTMKKVGVELGGKSANIVFSDADIETAARVSSEAMWENAGQVCMSPSRLLVQDEIYDEFLSAFMAHTDRLRVGDPFSPSTEMGPVAAKSQYETVREYISIGLTEGATASESGILTSEVGNGYFIRPTVLTDVRNDMRVAQEEIFGPVLSVIRFHDEDEAVRIANATAFDLSAGLWTSNIGRGMRVSRALRGGTVWINTFGKLDPALSFGGYQLSGNSRELGPESVRSYMQVKSVILDQSV